MCLYSDNSKDDHCPFDHHCSTKPSDKSNKTVDHTDANMPRNTSQDHVPDAQSLTKADNRQVERSSINAKCVTGIFIQS